LNETADIAVRPIAGIGRVLLWNGASLWIGRAAGRVAPHAHHAIQVALALSGRIRFRTGAHEPWVEHAGALVRSHQRHEFDGCGEAVAQIFVEPETLAGRALLQRQGSEPIRALAVDVAEALAAPLGAALAANATKDEFVAVTERTIARLAGGVRAMSEVDPRIARVIEHVRARRGAPISLAEAAALAHLSPSRFRHLFAEQTGTPFRPYLLWVRVGAAVEAAMAGQSWTDAAQDWGFADSAHLSRTCRRMFGIAPSSLIAG
jgi:AraC-like DNA-binding protein